MQSNISITAPPEHLVRHKHVVVIIPDATRALPTASLLAQLLPQLQTYRPLSIKVLVALGLHRAMTDEELSPITKLCATYDVELVQHQPHDPQHLTRLADNIHLDPTQPDKGQALPVVLNAHLTCADTIFCLGLVEPHQYAGFSGGTKIISIGCAGSETIRALHGLELLRDPHTTLIETHKNPFRTALDRIVSYLNADLYGIHVVPSHEPTLFQGDLHECFTQSIAYAENTLLEPHETTYPWVHIKVSGVKGVNFYQASRAATYVGLGPRSILQPGAPILLEAPCTEGFGQGRGEQMCAQMVQRGAKVLYDELVGNTALPAHINLEGGAQRAYVLAKLLSKHPLILITPDPIASLPSDDIQQFKTLDDAMHALKLHGSNGPVLQNVFHHLPVLS